MATSRPVAGPGATSKTIAQICSATPSGPREDAVLTRARRAMLPSAAKLAARTQVPPRSTPTMVTGANLDIWAASAGNRFESGQTPQSVDIGSVRTIVLQPGHLQ